MKRSGMKRQLWWIRFLLRPAYWPWLLALAPWTSLALVAAIGLLAGWLVRGAL